MVRFFRRIRHPGPALAIYVACLALVCSFILFEVLDVDGSDFPTRAPTSAMAIRLAEPPHDLKRAHLQALAEGWLDSCRLFSSGQDRSPRLRPAIPGPAPVSPAHAQEYRPILARASVADPLPSA